MSRTSYIVIGIVFIVLAIGLGLGIGAPGFAFAFLGVVVLGYALVGRHDELE